MTLGDYSVLPYDGLQRVPRDVKANSMLRGYHVTFKRGTATCGALNYVLRSTLTVLDWRRLFVANAAVHRKMRGSTEGYNTSTPQSFSARALELGS